MKIQLPDIKGYSQKEMDHMAKEINQLVDNLSRTYDLNISSLEEIIFSEDFSKSVIDFQRRHHTKVNGHTKNEYGTAIGKTMSFSTDGEKKQVIIFNAGVLDIIFAPDSQKFGINIVHHELCHVHDEWNKWSIYKDEDRSGGDLKHILYLHADAVWSEYIANKLSFNTATNETPEKISDFLNNIDKIENEIIEMIKSYRFHADAGKLFGQIQGISSFLLVSAGSAHGNLVEIPEAHEVHSEINGRMKGKCLEGVWKDMGIELEILFNKYPKNWQGISQLDNFGKIIIRFWNELGIYPKMTESGIYIDVPF